MQTRATRSATDAVAGDAQRKLMLERLEGSVPAIGHVRVDRAGALCTTRRSHAARNRLVVSKSASAEAEIIHRPATRGRYSLGSCLRQRAQQNIGDALRSLDVTRCHRG